MKSDGLFVEVMGAGYNVSGAVCWCHFGCDGVGIYTLLT